MQGRPPQRPGDRVYRRAVPVPLRIAVESEEVRPPRQISSMLPFYAFGAIILLGAILLWLPWATKSSGSGSFLDALFTSASALTDTGLAVKDTSSHWTPFGQGVILALMQIGGLGIMTMATLLLLLIGQRVTLREMLLAKESLSENVIGGLFSLMRRVALTVFLVEGVGTLLLFLLFSRDAPASTALWQAVFHSVAAFNNAGFSIFPQNLMGFQEDPSVLLVIAALIILGGISFTVIVDVLRSRQVSRFTLDTKLVLVTSLVLWALGTAVIFLGEYSNGGTLGPMSVPGKLLNSFFQSVSARSAGFNTVDTSLLKEGTLFFMVGLMFIGAASGSTGGGIKVNTLAVILSAVVSSIRGRGHLEVFRREIPADQVYKAASVLTTSAVFVFVSVILLGLTMTGGRFLGILFETVSAFGTVGLSTGIEGQLTALGKLILIVTMYMGRFGPLTLALALAQREKRAVYRYGQERVKIG